MSWGGGGAALGGVLWGGGELSLPHTTLTPPPTPSSVVVGSAHGDMAIIDLRQGEGPHPNPPTSNPSPTV